MCYHYLGSSVVILRNMTPPKTVILWDPGELVATCSTKQSWYFLLHKCRQLQIAKAIGSTSIKQWKCRIVVELKSVRWSLLSDNNIEPQNARLSSKMSPLVYLLFQNRAVYHDMDLFIKTGDSYIWIMCSNGLRKTNSLYLLLAFHPSVTALNQIWIIFHSNPLIILRQMKK